MDAVRSSQMPQIGWLDAIRALRWYSKVIFSNFSVDSVSDKNHFRVDPDSDKIISVWTHVAMKSYRVDSDSVEIRSAVAEQSVECP
jgi:hypothetical protein